MTQASTNVTFKNGAYATVTGVGGSAAQQKQQELTVEIVATDPTDLTTTFPRVWINSTSGVMKFTVDGTTTKTVTAT